MHHYVYLLTSITEPNRHYTGYTTDLTARLQSHNNGQSSHMNKYRPWHIETALSFSSEEKAHAFERYLKTGSGRAFAKRHF